MVIDYLEMYRSLKESTQKKISDWEVLKDPIEIEGKKFVLFSDPYSLERHINRLTDALYYLRMALKEVYSVKEGSVLSSEDWPFSGRTDITQHIGQCIYEELLSLTVRLAKDIFDVNIILEDEPFVLNEKEDGECHELPF